MSVEAPIGGMSAGAGKAIGGPAIAGASVAAEIGSGPSFAGPKISAEASGGSFTPNVSMDSLFSETTPFSASTGGFLEHSIANPESIFSENSWATLATANKADSLMHADIFSQTVPFVVSDSDMGGIVNLEPAKGIFSDKIAWEVIAKATVADVVDMQPGEWLSIAPNKPVQEVAAKTDSIAELFSATQVLIPEIPHSEVFSEGNIDDLRVVAEAQIIEKAKTIPEEDVIQADRVAELLVEVGVYSQDQAKQRVQDIMDEVNGIDSSSKTNTNGQVEISINEQEETMGVSQAVGESAGSGNTTAQEADLEEDIPPEIKSKNKPSKDEFVLTTYAIDENAQRERKATFVAEAEEIFDVADSANQETVDAIDVAKVDEEAKHRSELLYQSGLKVPDGSFRDVQKDIESLVGVVDNTAQGKQKVIDAVDRAINANVAVKAVRGVGSTSATEDDAQKVLKFAKTPVISSSSFR